MTIWPLLALILLTAGLFFTLGRLDERSRHHEAVDLLAERDEARARAKRAEHDLNEVRHQLDHVTTQRDAVLKVLRREQGRAARTARGSH